MGVTADPPDDRPVLFKPLMDLACDQPSRDIEKELVDAARRSAEKVSQLVWKAYHEGVRDGFTQGVQHAITAASKDKQ